MQKIDLNLIDSSDFDILTGVIAGEECYLIQPKSIKTKFTQENKILRSSIWNAEGYPVSLGLPKFVNFGENPEHFPPPNSLDGCTIVDKIDGSCLIVSKYKGEWVIRTRGQFNTEKMPNNYEIDYFKCCMYKSVFTHNLSGTWDYSVIFEWVSKEIKSVIKHNNRAELFLTGLIYHDDYALMPQSRLDRLAEDLKVSRPHTYNINYSNPIELIEEVKKWENKEGVCLYSPDGQSIWKIKSDDYKIKSRLVSEFSNIENIIDLFINLGSPSYHNFYNYISENVDYEIAVQVSGEVSKICDAYKNVLNIISGIKGFVEPLKALPRKDAALKITSSYGSTGRSGMCFKLLDNKDLDKDDLKKLLYQCIKK